MKSTSLLRTLALPLLAFAASAIVFADERPRLDAVRAARIASDYLATLGPNAPFIMSVALEKSAIFNGEPSWVVRWSRTISGDGDQEIGLRVRLDGATSRLILGNKDARRLRAGPAPGGVR